MCRTVFELDRCLSIQPGNVMNVEVVMDIPLPWKGKMSLAEFNALEQEVLDFVHVFESNLGTKYLVSCPASCKIHRSNFYQLFHTIYICSPFTHFNPFQVELVEQI